MRLDRRFFLLGSVLFLVASLLISRMFSRALDEINQVWSHQFVERQVLYDRYRTLSPLIEEVRLARLLVKEPAIVNMALNEGNPLIRQAGLKVFEAYRGRFLDHTVFLALAHSGDYYFNDAQGVGSDRPLRYQLSRDDPDDRWFYQTLGSGQPYQINIARDAHTGETCVWINVPIVNGGEVVGIAGTGIPLDSFLLQTVHLRQEGVENFFVNDQLAIQLAGDPRLIDYASITRAPGDHSTLDHVLSMDALDKLRTLIRTRDLSRTPVVETLVHWRGRKYLLGVSALSDLGWYDVTLVDMKSLALTERIHWLLYLLGGASLLVLGILGFALHRWVLRPIKVLKNAADAITRGQYDGVPNRLGSGEIGDLARSFSHMASVVEEIRRDLERKVVERTEALQRLTELDTLTGLLNRRGLLERLDNELYRLERVGGTLGLLMLDLDHFKQINDNYGHGAGDLALIHAAQVLKQHKRAYDYVGRYGGEEFLMLLPGCLREDMGAIAERIREAIESLQLSWEGKEFRLTTSIGMYHVEGTENRDSLLNKTDKAMYAAKTSGRNCVRMFEEVFH